MLTWGSWSTGSLITSDVIPKRKSGTNMPLTAELPVCHKVNVTGQCTIKVQSTMGQDIIVLVLGEDFIRTEDRNVC